MLFIKTLKNCTDETLTKALSKLEAGQLHSITFNQEAGGSRYMTAHVVVDLPAGSNIDDYIGVIEQRNLKFAEQ